MSASSYQEMDEEEVLFIKSIKDPSNFIHSVVSELQPKFITYEDSNLIPSVDLIYSLLCLKRKSHFYSKVFKNDKSYQCVVQKWA